MAKKLLDFLYQESITGRALPGNFSKHFSKPLTQPKILTTHFAKQLNPALLPWHYPNWLYQMHHLLLKRRWIKWPPELTVCSCSLAYSKATATETAEICDNSELLQQ